MYIHTILDARHENHVTRTVERIADNAVESTTWKRCYTCDSTDNNTYTFRYTSTTIVGDMDAWDGHTPIGSHLTRIQDGLCDICHKQKGICHQDSWNEPGELICEDCIASFDRENQATLDYIMEVD